MPQLRLLLLSALIHAYQLPSPYTAKPPHGFGHYCNGTDPYWWEGYLYVDLWGTLEVYENCTVRVTQFDSIELHNNARLLAEWDTRLELRDWNHVNFFSETIFRNSSSLTLSDHCSLETKSGLLLGAQASMAMNRFCSALVDGGLRLGDRSKLTIADFSQLVVGPKGNLSLGPNGRVTVSAFSSLLISGNAGLRIEPDASLTLSGHATLEISNSTWIRLTKDAIVSEHTRLVIGGDQGGQDASKSIGFEYMTDIDFGRLI